MLLDNQNFDRSEWQAWNSGKPLAAHLLNLNSGASAGKFRLFGHSMGNVVCSEALRILTKSGDTNVVHTYVSCQGALASHAYDPSTAVRVLTLENPVIPGGSLINADSGTRNIYAEFPVDGSPAYLAGIQGANNFINYHNNDDYALGSWCANQSLKPDIGSIHYRGYRYTPAIGFWQGYYGPDNIPVARILDEYSDRFEIFGMAAEARCYAIGAQPNVGGAFRNQLDLQAAFGFGKPGYDHSAQFNSNIQARHLF